MSSYSQAMSKATWTALVDKAISILEAKPDVQRYAFQSSNANTIELLKLYRDSYSQRVNSVVNEILASAEA